MVNTDSDLYRAHPDWVLRAGDGLPDPWRHQQVLDLAVPEAWEHVLGQLDALLRRPPASTTSSGTTTVTWSRPVTPGRPGVHGQTLAVYRLLDELRARHPGVEIESCASGGARVDLGILARTDRVWASDTNDALERQTIQRWTQLLLPPELVGSHVGPPRVAHDRRAPTTCRSAARPRCSATSASSGTSASLPAEDLASLARAGRDLPQAPVAAARRRRRARRPPGPRGDRARCGGCRPERGADGLREPDQPSSGGARSGPTARAGPRRRLPGRPGRHRRRAVDQAASRRPAGGRSRGAAGPVLPGAFLERVGLPMPVLGPEQAVVLHLTRA